jgi:hypothetical protein
VVGAADPMDAVLGRRNDIVEGATGQVGEFHPAGCGNAFMQLTRRSTACTADLRDCGHDHLGT